MALFPSSLRQNSPLTQALPISSWGSTVGLARLSEDCKRSPTVSREASLEGEKKKGEMRETLWSNFQLFLFANVLFEACLNGFPGDDVAGVCKWILLCISVCGHEQLCIVHYSTPMNENFKQTNHSGTPRWLSLKVNEGNKRYEILSSTSEQTAAC